MLLLFLLQFFRMMLLVQVLDLLHLCHFLWRFETVTFTRVSTRAQIILIGRRYLWRKPTLLHNNWCTALLYQARVLRLLDPDDRAIR